MQEPAGFTKAAPITGAASLPRDTREPSSLPEIGTDELCEYVLKLHNDCPVEQVIIFGQNIPKYMVSPDATLLENKGKPIFRNVLVRSLTEKQVQAILERAKITPIHVNRHKDFDDPKGEKWIKEYFGYASDWLIIERFHRETVYELPTLKRMEEEKGADELDRANKELIKQQVERAEEKGKKKK